MAATKTNHAAAFAAELAELMERHETFLHVDHEGNLIACHFGGDEMVIGRPEVQRSCHSVSALRLRKKIEATTN